MDLELNGKTALVTGSTAGIGLAIATALAKEGAAVIVNGRTQERVDRALAASGAAHGLAAGLGTEAGARATIERSPRSMDWSPFLRQTVKTQTPLMTCPGI
jgi:NAD(P)-dependent dehydrogenase (short-subunit alcohol dehydrogenase family)